MKSPSNGAIDWLLELAGDAAQLPRPQKPKPYYSQREAGPITPENASPAVIAQRVYRLVRQFFDQDFFAETVGFDCVDGNGDTDSSPEDELERRVGKPALWNGTFEDVSDLCDFIEVFHDLSSRPTRGWVHQFCNCGWHPSAYSRKSGQALYRWRMNELLDSTTLGLRLADEGEDIGRMVRAPAGELSHLMAEALSHESSSRDDLVHAIALFRSRGATLQDRRSAIVTLAGVLEERRSMLKSELLSKDEGALFDIANNFNLRHRKADQHADYDEVYLDWVFYLYLATVRLTDQLRAKQA